MKVTRSLQLHIDNVYKHFDDPVSLVWDLKSVQSQEAPSPIPPPNAAPMSCPDLLYIVWDEKETKRLRPRSYLRSKAFQS